MKVSAEVHRRLSGTGFDDIRRARKSRAHAVADRIAAICAEDMTRSLSLSLNGAKPHRRALPCTGAASSLKSDTPMPRRTREGAFHTRLIRGAA